MKKIKVKARIVDKRLLYVIMACCIDDKYIDSIWDNEKLADKRIENLIKKDKYYKNNPEDLYVDVVTLNEPVYN